jgi:multiple sugar transport system substrate-binding protein
MMRWLVRVLPFVLVASVAIACTGKEASQPATSGQPLQGTINLWIFEGEDAFVPTLVKGFEAEHPGLKVKVTDIPEDNYVTKIDTALAAGEPPDIGYMYEARWIKAGRVEALDDVIASHGIDTANYNQNAFSFCVLDGKTYCLGSYAGAIMLFYNKDLFDKAGEPYPSATEPMTIDEYAALSARLTQPNDDRSKYVWGGYADVTTWWLDWRDLFSEDGQHAEGYVNDASTIHMYDVLAKMVRDGDSPSESDFDFFGNTDPLATGQMAMTIVDNVVAIPTLEKAGINWGAAPVPVEKEGDPAWVSSWSDAWSVFEGGGNTEAAKEFVAFAGTEGNTLRANAGQMPLDSTVAVDTGWAGDSPGRKEALQVMQLARPGIFLPANVFTIDPPLWDAFTLMVEGDKDAQTAINDAAPDMQQNLDRAWQTWNET